MTFAQIDVSGSPAWALYFGVFCGIVLLLELIQGWRDGLSRKFFQLNFLLFAVAAGIWLPPLLVPGNTIMAFFQRFALGFGLIGGIYILGALITLIFTTPTRKQEGMGLKLIWGLGGTSLGVINGLIWITVFLVGIRIVGTVGSAWTAVYNARVHGLPEGVSAPEPPSGIASALPYFARMKNSVFELIPASEQLARLDPVPEEAYRIIDKVTRVASNDEALIHFANQPKSKEIIQHPLFQDLAADPEIRTLAEERDIPKLLTHPRLQKLAHNEELVALLEEYDLEASLDEALAHAADSAPAKAPSPERTP